MERVARWQQSVPLAHLRQGSNGGFASHRKSRLKCIMGFRERGTPTTCNASIATFTIQTISFLIYLIKNYSDLKFTIQHVEPAGSEHSVNIWRRQCTKWPPCLYLYTVAHKLSSAVWINTYGMWYDGPLVDQNANIRGRGQRMRVPCTL